MRSVRGSAERSEFTFETFNIQYYFLAGRSRRGAHTNSRAAGGLLCQSCFRLRVKLTEETGGGNLRSNTAPEGPHNTTEVLSAKELYHTLMPIVGNKSRGPPSAGGSERIANPSPFSISFI